MYFFGKIKGVFYIPLKTKDLFLKYVKYNREENQIDIQGMPNPCS